MGYPAEWRDFYERHLLPREGGYVPGRGTLLGVVPEVWVRAIPNIPQEEINAQPEWSRTRLEAIRRAPASARPAMVTAWINGVRDQLQPWGNGSGHTFEYAKPGGNEAIVSGAHNLAFSIIYREYIRDTGISSMQVEPRTQETISDSCMRYGEGYAYSLLARAIVSSGIRTEAQLNGTLLNALDKSPLAPITDPAVRNAVGYVPTTDIANRSTYRPGQPGYAYTTDVGRRAVTSILHDLSPQQQQALFDEFGRWRRIYDMNKPRSSERAGDMARTEALHGTYADYNARRAARGQATALSSTADSTGASSVTLAIPGVSGSVDMALVQVAIDRNLFTANNYNVGIEFPGLGRVSYRLKPQLVTDADGRRHPGYVVDTDAASRPTLPPGMVMLSPGQRAMGITNPYSEGVVLVWRDAASNQVKTFAIGPQLNQLAFDMGQANNTTLGFTNGGFNGNFTLDANGRLDPAYSAGVIFSGQMGERPGWVATVPNPQDYMRSASIAMVSPAAAATVTEPAPPRTPQNVTITPAETRLR